MPVTAAAGPHADEHAPDPRALVIGLYLRQARVEAGLTQEQVAARGICSVRTLSAAERGERMPSPRMVRAIADRLGVPDEVRDQLVLLTLEDPGRGWWEESTELPHAFRSYVRLEDGCRELAAVEQGVFHGLLQTAGYARAVALATGAADPDAVVRMRLRRQEHVLGPGRPAGRVPRIVLGEDAWCRVVGSRAQLDEQRAQAVRLHDEGLVEVRVLPFAAGLPTGFSRGPFTLFRLELASAFSLYLGYTEQLDVARVLVGDPVETYRRAWREIHSRAVPVTAFARSAVD